MAPRFSENLRVLYGEKCVLVTKTETVLRTDVWNADVCLPEAYWQRKWRPSVFVVSHDSGNTALGVLASNRRCHTAAKLPNTWHQAGNQAAIRTTLQCASMAWIQLAQDRTEWRALVNMISLKSTQLLCYLSDHQVVKDYFMERETSTTSNSKA